MSIKNTEYRSANLTSRTFYNILNLHIFYGSPFMPSEWNAGLRFVVPTARREYWGEAPMFSCSLYCGRETDFFFNLNFLLIDYIYIYGCARRGASGALFPKSASCGAEFPLKGFYLGAYKSI